MQITPKELLKHYKDYLQKLLTAAITQDWQSSIDHQYNIEVCQATIDVLEKEVPKKPTWVVHNLTEEEKEHGMEENEPVAECPCCHNESRANRADNWADDWFLQEEERCAACNQLMDWDGERTVFNEADQARLDI